MTADAGPPVGSHAVLIGVSAYEYAEFPPIRAARNSLQATQSLLVDPALCGWLPELITVIANPISAAALADRVADLAETTTGVFLLYYVGHGVLSTRGELCLTVTSTRPNRPKITGLPWETLAEVLRTCPARIRLAILDCCFAGQAIEALGADADQALADITHVDGVYTLAATTRNRTAHVPPADQQDTACTSFTGELQALIRSGIPGKPSQLTFSDIYPELRQRLRAKGLPAPSQCGTDTAHQFPFTANTAACFGSTAHVIQPQDDDKPILVTPPARLRQARILTAALHATWSIPDEEQKASALARVAEAVAGTDPGRAARLTADAERIARSIPDPCRKASTLADIAQAGADPDHAVRLTAEAEDIAQSIADGEQKASALANVAQVVAGTDPRRAERIALSIPDGYRKASVLADIAEAVAVTDPDGGERIAQSISDEHSKASALARVAEAVAGTDPVRGERIALSITAEHLKASALARVAGAVAAAHPNAAESIAQSIPDEEQKASALARVAEAVAGTDPDRAEGIAQSIPDERRKALVLAGIAEVMAGTDPDRAERIAQSISAEHLKASALVRVAEAAASTDPDRAEGIAQSISDPYQKASALARVAGAAVAADPDYAALEQTVPTRS